MISKGANRSRFELSLTVVRKKKSGFGSLVSLRRRSATAPRTEVVNIDTIVSYVKDRSDDTLLHISFGVPWYVNMREAIERRHMVSKPRMLQFKSSEDRDDFCVSLVWSKKTNRDIFRKRHMEAMFNRLLSGGVGKVWFVGFNSTGRWQPHILVWRLSSVTSDRGLVVILRQRTNQDREVKVKFSSSRLVRIEQCPPELSGDLVDRGIVMAGGGGLLRGIERLVAKETQLPVTIAEDPLISVANGTGKVLQNIDYWRNASANA